MYMYVSRWTITNRYISVYANRQVLDIYSELIGEFYLSGLARFLPNWQLSPFSSPCPSLPNRPITILHGSEVIWMRPIHHSHSFCSPIFLAETLGRRALKWKSSEIQRVLMLNTKVGQLKRTTVHKSKAINNFSTPVGYINVDNAGFQELPLLVGAGHQDPALVMW